MMRARGHANSLDHIAGKQRHALRLQGSKKLKVATEFAPAVSSLPMAGQFVASSRAPRAHLVGCCGAGMQALWAVLRQRGWHLTGSDLCLGGHAAAKVTGDRDLVVHSAAIDPAHCELYRARQLGIPTVSYPEMLAALMRQQHGLAVAGTHGKSTTTAMAASILLADGRDPTVIYGAAGGPCRHGGRSGKGPECLVEACEYRRSFLHLGPQRAVILGLEHDHFDCYRSLEAMQHAYLQFAQRVPRGGWLLLNADCPRALSIASVVHCSTATFALDAPAQWNADRITVGPGGTAFTLRYRRENLVRIRLGVAGRHQIANALAAAALALESGAKLQAVVDGLQGFAGLKRRCEAAGTIRGVRWIDDYAHHPTAIAATLTTLREAYPQARLWCIFEPHQRSRTAALLDRFAAALCRVDHLWVAPVFQAREEPSEDGVSLAAALADAVRAWGGCVACEWEPEKIGRQLLRAIENAELTADDIIVTMGAGNIGRFGDGLRDRL